MRSTSGAERGVTLVELLVVLMVLSLILTAAVKTWDVTLERGRYEQTKKKLSQIASVIVGDANYVVDGRRADFGYAGDMGMLPRSLTDLVVAPPAVPPESSRWRGPYVRPAVNEAPESYKFDAWGDSIIYSDDSMFVRSLGGGGLADRGKWLTRPFGYTENAVTRNDVDGRVVDQTGAPPHDSLLSRLVTQLSFPRQGVMYRPNDSLGHNGTFLFQDVPQGTHLLRVIFIRRTSPPPIIEDTAYRDVVVIPGFGAHDIEVRLPTPWPANP